MRSPALMTVGLLLLATFLGACSAGAGRDCVSLCEEQKSRSCTGIQDCQAECDDDAARNAESGCAAQYDAILACEAAKPDICDDSLVACGDEVNSYWACIGSFCEDNPNSQICG